MSYATLWGGNRVDKPEFSEYSSDRNTAGMLFRACIKLVEASTCTVSLVHYTLQEYLLKNTDLFHSPHAMITQVYLTYLNFKCVKDLSPTLDLPSLEIPLLE